MLHLSCMYLQGYLRFARSWCAQLWNFASHTGCMYSLEFLIIAVFGQTLAYFSSLAVALVVLLGCKWWVGWLSGLFVECGLAAVPVLLPPAPSFSKGSSLWGKFSLKHRTKKTLPKVALRFRSAVPSDLPWLWNFGRKTRNFSVAPFFPPHFSLRTPIWSVFLPANFGANSFFQPPLKQPKQPPPPQPSKIYSPGFANQKAWHQK